MLSGGAVDKGLQIGIAGLDQSIIEGSRLHDFIASSCPDPWQSCFRDQGKASHFCTPEGHF